MLGDRDIFRFHNDNNDDISKFIIWKFHQHIFRKIDYKYEKR